MCATGWLFGVAACGEQASDEEAKRKPVPEKTIEQVLREHTESLMSVPGVVGTGEGECDSEPCIRVFVVEKTADLLSQIPSSLEGYAVEVQETGEIKALGP